LQNGETVYADIYPDPNEFQVLTEGGSFIFFTVFFEVYSGICLLLSLYKIQGFIAVYGIQMSVPQSVLCIEIFASIERMIYMIDPVFSNGIYPWRVENVFVTLSLPFSLASTLLIAFYWEEVMHSTRLSAIPSLKKFRWPAGICLFILYALELSSSLSRAYYVNLASLNVISAIIYVVVTVAVSIFFFICGHRILKVLRNKQLEKNKLSTRKNNLKRVTVLLVISGVAMILLSIFTLLYAIPPTTAGSLFFVFFMIYFSLISISFTQIMVLNRPAESGTSSGSKSSNSNKSDNPSDQVVDGTSKTTSAPKSSSNTSGSSDASGTDLPV